AGADDAPAQRQRGGRVVDREALAHPVVAGAARRGGDADAHRRARALTPAPDLEQPAVLLLAEQGRVVDRDAVVLTGQIEEALVPEVQARAAREAPRPLSRGAPTTTRG